MFLWVGISLIEARICRSYKGTRNDLRHYGCVERVLRVPNGGDARLNQDTRFHPCARFNRWNSLHVDGGVVVVSGTFIRAGPFSLQSAYLILELTYEFLRVLSGSLRWGRVSFWAFF